MPAIQTASSPLTSSRRVKVAIPTNRSTGSITRAKATNRVSKFVAWPTRARATAVADTTDRNRPARLNDSFQLSERVASRLQCSVERIWSARGSSRGRPPPAAIMPVPGPAARSAGGIRSSMADGPPLRTSRIGPEDTRPTDRSVARRLPTSAARTSVTGMAAQAPDARRALVLHDRPLLADLIELTLNHGLFVVRAAES